jgi:hypothetical protein
MLAISPTSSIVRAASAIRQIARLDGRMARRRVSSGRTDSVGNGIYQGRLVAQFD